VDSFEGQQLPPKSQIKSIHVTRDQFAAETAQPGSTFVDIITQAGVGPLRGGVNFSYRDGSMTSKSQFVTARGPERFGNYGANLSGTLIKERADFSLSFNGQNSYITPILNRGVSGTSAVVLGIRQPTDQFNFNGSFNYAVSKDQTLRLGYDQQRYLQNNLGIGNFDQPERAYSSRQTYYNFRIQEAGPLGRRTFMNTRLSIGRGETSSDSSVDLPTIVILDKTTTGGAQTRGGTYNTQVNLASDVDYIRGRNSWRAGVQMTGVWFRTDRETNYLGTYTFSDEASFLAGRPITYTRELGNPNFDYFMAIAAGYFQDDIRVREGLTLSPGVRFSQETYVRDPTAIEPRFGVTYAPTKATTLRASTGIFHGWLSPNVFEQAERFDGTHQQQVILTNPTYPEPNIEAGVVPPTNRYRIGSYQLQKNVRHSAGIDQVLSPKIRASVLYNYIHQRRLPRGENMNPIVKGVRADPTLANVIVSRTDGQIRRHEVFTTFNINWAAGVPAVNAARFNWRRFTINGGYSWIRVERNAENAFDVPPSGTLDTEWGPGPADSPYRFNAAFTSTQLKNLQINLSFVANAGQPYTLYTGKDDNGDGIVNDRPEGVGLRTLRMWGQETLSARVAYTLGMGQSPTPNQQRYRVQLFVSVNNLTNHANYGGFSGTMTSPSFMVPTYVNNPRRIDTGMNFNF
jgi:hypothetical protein